MSLNCFRFIGCFVFFVSSSVCAASDVVPAMFRSMLEHIFIFISRNGFRSDTEKGKLPQNTTLIGHNLIDGTCLLWSSSGDECIRVFGGWQRNDSVRFRSHFTRRRHAYHCGMYSYSDTYGNRSVWNLKKNVDFIYDFFFCSIHDFLWALDESMKNKKQNRTKWLWTLRSQSVWAYWCHRLPLQTTMTTDKPFYVNDDRRRW